MNFTIAKYLERFFGEEFIDSPYNGTIMIRRWFGWPEVYVDGFDQSTRYIRDMWRAAFRYVPRAGVKRVLMLGLCAGVGVTELRRRFPRADITVIDWDPAMITLFHRLNPQTLPITIIEGDAFAEMPKLDRAFDLVIVDLFKGKDPAPELLTDDALGIIGSVVAPGGSMVVNAFSTEAVLDAFDRNFARKSVWHYKFNTIALYTKETK